MHYKEYWQMKQRSAFINQILLHYIFIVSNFCSDMKVLLNDTKFYIVAFN